MAGDISAGTDCKKLSDNDRQPEAEAGPGESAAEAAKKAAAAFVSRLRANAQPPSAEGEVNLSEVANIPNRRFWRAFLKIAAGC